MMIPAARFRRSLYRLIVVWMAAQTAACVTPGTRAETGEVRPAVIEAVDVQPAGTGAWQVIVKTSGPAPYTCFQLVDPPRIVADVQATPAADLPRRIPVAKGPVEAVLIEPPSAGAAVTRLTLRLSAQGELEAAQEPGAIRLRFSLPPGEPAGAAAATEEEPSPAAGGADEPVTVGRAQAEPQAASGSSAQAGRIFFAPARIPHNQVLGVDFQKLPRGRSRLAITTNKAVVYHARRQGPQTLILELDDTVIPPLLLRHLDTTHFEGAVDRVTASFSAAEHRLAFKIALREKVPYELRQDDRSIQVEFGPSRVAPPDLKISPLPMSEAPKGPVKEDPRLAGGETETVIPGLGGKKYTGRRMTMDFVNAEVTNILRLIGEVSNLNIVWSPQVTGKVSMRLKNVPWDQALDLVLANNDLGMRRQGNVIWVTSRSHLKKIETEERQRREALEAERKKRIEEARKAEELEPLQTAYLPLDFAKAGEIKAHILLSPRGKLSVDERTNTLIIKDIPSRIEEARQIVRRFDAPVKQIMIEARIVDASTNFSRDLGVQWNSINRKWRERTGMDFNQNDPTQFTRAGDLTAGGTFSTNAPEGWAGNLGFTFARLTDGGLGTLALDATLALAETEGKVKIISAPKVIASNGEQALISRGDIIYKDVVTADRIDTREISATLSLVVTPTVSYNDYVTMDIEVTDDKAISENQKLEKRIKTKLMVKSGETLVIGGIFKEDEVLKEEGVPWLRDAPLLGWLFKTQNKSREKTELLIFLTPRVIETTPRRS